MSSYNAIYMVHINTHLSSSEIGHSFTYIRTCAYTHVNIITHTHTHTHAKIIRGWTYLFTCSSPETHVYTHHQHTNEHVAWVSG